MTAAVQYALVDSEGNAILDSAGNWRSIVYAIREYLQGDVVLRPALAGAPELIVPIQGSSVTLTPLLQGSPKVRPRN